MAFLWMVIVGLLIGTLAKAVMPGKDPEGFLVTLALGVGGSVVAGFIGRNTGLYPADNAAPGVIASVIGAVIILFVYRLIIGRPTSG